MLELINKIIVSNATVTEKMVEAEAAEETSTSAASETEETQSSQTSETEGSADGETSIVKEVLEPIE